MRIVEFNIQHGGGRRGTAIAHAVAAHEPDIIVLTEYRASNAARVLEPFAALGWPHAIPSTCDGAANGVCVLSRESLTRQSPPFRSRPFTDWWVQVLVPSSGVRLAALYGPSTFTMGSAGALKKQFWETLLRVAKRCADDPMLIVGDLNTGISNIDGQGPFGCSDEFAALGTLGWIDAWRHCSRGGTEFTWFSRRGTGRAGWRLDHAFVSRVLEDAVRDCRYSHEERRGRISDHSLLILNFDDQFA